MNNRMLPVFALLTSLTLNGCGSGGGSENDVGADDGFKDGHIHVEAPVDAGTLALPLVHGETWDPPREAGFHAITFHNDVARTVLMDLTVPARSSTVSYTMTIWPAEGDPITAESLIGSRHLALEATLPVGSVTIAFANPTASYGYDLRASERRPEDHDQEGDSPEDARDVSQESSVTGLSEGLTDVDNFHIRIEQTTTLHLTVPLEDWRTQGLVVRVLSEDGATEIARTAASDSLLVELEAGTYYLAVSRSRGLEVFPYSFTVEGIAPGADG
ncbi:MAG: hypothetical protein ACOCXJ_05885 [Planctomycetota bacterium]